jgi:hypothetical protein
MLVNVCAGLQTNNGRDAQTLGPFLIEGEMPSISNTKLSSKYTARTTAHSTEVSTSQNHLCYNILTRSTITSFAIDLQSGFYYSDSISLYKVCTQPSSCNPISARLLDVTNVIGTFL